MQAGLVLSDRYQVVGSLASGGMGAVHQAVDRRLANTPCVLKEILEHRLKGPDAAYLRQRFEAEMAVLAKLEHPGIPRVRDYFSHDFSFYIVMDFVDGVSLDRELATTLEVTGRPCEPEVVAADMLQVLEILSYLHGHKPPLLHRDVKPANLVRESRTGRLKLVDFGLARELEGSGSQTMVGTPGYCAPEQMSGHAEPRSDLYSVGVTMHHLLSGQRPLPLDLTPLASTMPDYRPRLAAIVERATAFKVELRYRDCLEMATELRAWLQETRVGEVLAPSPPPRLAEDSTPPSSQETTTLPPGPSRLLPVVLALGGALGLALLAGHREPLAATTFQGSPSLSPAPAPVPSLGVRQPTQALSPAPVSSPRLAQSPVRKLQASLPTPRVTPGFLYTPHLGGEVAYPVHKGKPQTHRTQVPSPPPPSTGPPPADSPPGPTSGGGRLQATLDPFQPHPVAGYQASNEGDHWCLHGPNGLQGTFLRVNSSSQQALEHYLAVPQDLSAWTSDDRVRAHREGDGLCVEVPEGSWKVHALFRDIPGGCRVGIFRCASFADQAVQDGRKAFQP